MNHNGCNFAASGHVAAHLVDKHIQGAVNHVITSPER